jgi:hypothetical protein
MADKTGVEELITILENLYVDYLAFRHIARTACPEKWAVHLNDYRKAKRPQVVPQFHAILVTLQSATPSVAASYDAAAQRVANFLVDGMLS